MIFLTIVVVLAIIAALQLITYKLMWNITECDYERYATPFPTYLYYTFHIPILNVFMALLLRVILWDIYNNK